MFVVYTSVNIINIVAKYTSFSEVNDVVICILSGKCQCKLFNCITIGTREFLKTAAIGVITLETVVRPSQAMMILTS